MIRLTEQLGVIVLACRHQQFVIFRRKGFIAVLITRWDSKVPTQSTEGVS